MTSAVRVAFFSGAVFCGLASPLHHSSPSRPAELFIQVKSCYSARPQAFCLTIRDGRACTAFGWGGLLGDGFDPATAVDLWLECVRTRRRCRVTPRPLAGTYELTIRLTPGGEPERWLFEHENAFGLRRAVRRTAECLPGPQPAQTADGTWLLDYL